MEVQEWELVVLVELEQGELKKKELKCLVVLCGSPKK